jgi:hypothetical protein
MMIKLFYPEGTSAPPSDKPAHYLILKFPLKPVIAKQENIWLKISSVLNFVLPILSYLFKYRYYTYLNLFIREENQR